MPLLYKNEYSFSLFKFRRLHSDNYHDDNNVKNNNGAFATNEKQRAKQCSHGNDYTNMGGGRKKKRIQTIYSQTRLEVLAHFEIPAANSR